LFVCTKGQADTSVVGELYVEYDVVFSTPQTSMASLSGYLLPTAGMSKTVAYGTSRTQTGALDASYSGSTITFNQAWEGLVTWYFTGTGLAASTLTGTAVSSSIATVVNSAGTISIQFARVRALPGETLIGDWSASTTVSSGTVRLSQYQYSLA
jgi:hypothetical protein